MMIKNKLFVKCIVVTLLVALLTFNVGKVTRVSAVGTTAAIAGTAFILTGAVYLSYIALTQGEMVLPAAEEMHDWLGSIGRKVSQYPSGAAAYQDIYQGLARSPIGNVIDGVWSWTQDRLRSFANDFSDTRIISDIVSYTAQIDTDLVPTNGFDYSAYTINPIPEYISISGNIYTFAQAQQTFGYVAHDYTGAKVIGGTIGTNTFIYGSNITYPVRNLLTQNGYKPQALINSNWTDIPYDSYYGVLFTNRGGAFMGTGLTIDSINYLNFSADYYRVLQGVSDVPLFPFDVIHDQATDEDLPMVIPQDTITRLPSWVDPDNENRPIIPWVPIPNLPTGVPTPPGYTGTPQWGFPLQDLLDLLESLSEALMEIGAIGELINQFAGLHGDEYYLYYDEGDTNYYTYYQPTIFDDDNVIYNINVSDVDEHLPVDLNTIEIYSNNRYIDAFKQSAQAGSSIVRDLVVFWYDVDPEIIYVVFGCCILTLIAAFIGKWGHS